MFGSNISIQNFSCFSDCYGLIAASVAMKVWAVWAVWAVRAVRITRACVRACNRLGRGDETEEG